LTCSVVTEPADALAPPIHPVEFDQQGHLPVDQVAPSKHADLVGLDDLEMSLPTPNHLMSLRLEGFQVRLDGGWSNPIYWNMSLVIQLDWVDLEGSLPTSTIQ